MKELILEIREYVNFCVLCKKNKIKHDFMVIHGDIHVLANSVKLKELGY